MSFRRLTFLFLFFLEFGCQKKAVGPPPRYAVPRFENLSGDPSMDWMGRAVSEALPQMLNHALDGPVMPSSALTHYAPALGVRPASAPGDSSERSEALAAGATRLVTGYVEHVGGRIRIVAMVSDLADGKTMRTVSAEGTTALSAIEALAHSLAGKHAPAPYLTTNPEALQMYATGLESAPDTGAAEMEHAVGIDPHFGPAWVTLARLDALRGDRAEAAAVIGRAKNERVDALSAANLELEEANLAGKTTDRLAAMRKIGLLTSSDAGLMQTLAEAESTAGEFSAAVSDWKRVVDVQPDNPNAWNALAYNRAYVGDFAGARAALAEYRRRWPKDPNALDSTGDIEYLARRFNEAAKAYADAYAIDQNFLANGDLYKGAWAKLEAGDKAGADALFARYKDAREKAKDPMMRLREADWLYRTGRTDQAMAILSVVGKDPEAGLARFSAAAQLTIWELIGGDRSRAMQDIGTLPLPTGAAVIARFAAMPSATTAEWEQRADQIFAAPGLAGVKRLALGYALLLDHKRTDAAVIWKQIAADTPATDFFIQAMAARTEGKTVSEPLIPNPANLNEFAALPDKI